MKILPLAGAALLLAACQTVPISPEPAIPATQMPFTFELETDSATRSCYSEAEASAVRQAVVAVYSESGVLVHSGRPETAVVLNRDHPYSYYVMTGDLAEEDIPGREAALRGLIHRYGMDGDGGFVRYHDSWNAVPMAGKVLRRTPASLDTDGDGVIRLGAERLFARIDLRIRLDESLRDNYTVDVRSVRVQNFARSVAPFEADLNDRSQVVPCEADITREADGQGIWTLYLPENRQGNLLPDNTDPARKTAGSLSAAGYDPDLCTFIEATVDYATGYGIGGSVRYRFYPGSDNTGNFDILRNTPYAVTLLLSANGLNIEGDWKIDTSDLLDKRELELTPLTETVAQGGMAILRCRYLEDGADREEIRFDARPGYSVGLPDEVDRYLAGGTAAGHTRYTGIDVMCDDCDHVYPGYPEGASFDLRLAWFRNVLTDDGLGSFLCTECGNDLGDETDAEIFHNDPLPASEQHPVRLVAVPLPAGATAGSDLTFAAATHDGRQRVEAHVIVVRTGQLSIDTHLVPKYLAMRGSATVRGTPQGVDHVAFRLVEGDGVVTLSASGKTCGMTATGMGHVTVAVSDASSGEELDRFSFDVTAPVLAIANPSVLLNPNGDAETVESRYYTATGSPLRRGQEFDEALYDALLRPVFSTTGPYLACNASTGEVWLSSISGIPTGTANPVGTVQVRAIACPEAGTPSIRAYCIDPFHNMSGPETRLAGIDDYTLCIERETPSQSVTLEGHVNAPTFRVLAEPRLAASPACESIQFTVSPGNIHVLTMTCGADGSHAFGKIDISLGVENARTHECLYRKIGYVEVYLHGQIGGKAILHADPLGEGNGWVSCSTMTYPAMGNSSFDDLYTLMTGHPCVYDTFDETNLYKVGDTYYQSDDNDRYGIARRPENPEDRPYLTRYVRSPGLHEGLCYPTGEVYRIYAGSIDTYYGYFASRWNLMGCGKAFFLLRFDLTDIPGVIWTGTEPDRQYGLAGETDANGIPYRQLGTYHGWMVVDTV